MPRFKSMSDIEVLKWIKNLFVERKNYLLASKIRQIETETRQSISERKEEGCYWCKLASHECAYCGKKIKADGKEEVCECLGKPPFTNINKQKVCLECGCKIKED